MCRHCSSIGSKEEIQKRADEKEKKYFEMKEEADRSPNKLKLEVEMPYESHFDNSFTRGGCDYS